MMEAIGQIINQESGKQWGQKGYGDMWKVLPSVPKLYTVVAGVPVLPDRATPATEEQIEAKETKIAEFEKWEYLAQYIILSTTSTRLGGKIKDMTSAEKMWKIVKNDATTQSTLYLLDAEDQLCSMKLSNNNDSKAHLTELKQHFQLMLQCCNSLVKMGPASVKSLNGHHYIATHIDDATHETMLYF